MLRRALGTSPAGQGITQTLDCNESSNIDLADNVINDITVCGYDHTVLFHNGDPYLLDRGRELGMTNRIDRVPA